MKTPLLSITIPTYSRAHYLVDCLNSIKIQFDANKELEELVEIVISDNASTDNTEEVAKNHGKNFKKFVYVRNEKNLGFDLNVLNVVRNASGKYCWYLSDDDVIINGGIDYIVEKLKTDEYDVITVGSSPVTENSYTKRQMFNDTEIFETRNADDFFHGNNSLGGVSNLIFDREQWLACVDVDGYLEWWLYNETVVHIFTVTNKKLLNVLQTLVYTGQDCRWSENGGELTTFINSNLMLERIATFGFDKKRIHAILTENRKLIPIVLLRAKGHGLVCNMKNLRFMRKNMKKVGPFYLTLATVLFFIPNSLIVFARDSKKSIRKILK